MADSKASRRYQAGIERALALFDAKKGWADYIAFLSRLLKSLQHPPEEAEIPSKSVIAYRLACCMRPSLPSGVHQKALEVYESIFSIIGPQGIAKDLSLYLPGLSHTLSFASLSTRPQFLSIYENHILPLRPKILRPALRALILALLPGIEEETSEDFENVLSTFDHLRQKFLDDGHEETFWQNLFLASITNPNRRAGVIVYLARYLPKLASRSASQDDSMPREPITDAMKAVTTPEPGLLARCFATGLQDTQPLVQRGFLDLLVSHLPLNAFIFADHSHTDDLDVLVNASVTVVLRRDMSLNRRLWTWFTGPENRTAVNETSASETPTSPTLPRGNTQKAQYFSTYGLASLIRSITTMLSGDYSEPLQRARPFRIASSLMDRWEIGGRVVEALFVPLLQSLKTYQATAPSQEAFDEVFRSANVFFDGIEGRLILNHLLDLLQNEHLDLVAFVINNFSLEEDDMVQTHVPLICLFIIDRIRSRLTSSSEPLTLEWVQTTRELGKIFESLVMLIPAGALVGPHQHDESGFLDLQARILNAYEEASSSRQFKDPFPSGTVTLALIERASHCLLTCIREYATDKDLIAALLNAMNQCIALLNDIQNMEQIQLVSQLSTLMQNTPVSMDNNYQVLMGMVNLISTLHLRDQEEKVLKQSDLCDMIPTLVTQIWYFLLPSTPQYHVEAAESIWRLHSLSQSTRLVESTLGLLLTDLSLQSSSTEPSMQRFSTLWVHSKAASKLLQSSNTHGTSPSDEVLDLLGNSLLFIVDLTDVNVATNPCSQWVKSLSTLDTLFDAVFRVTPDDVTDIQRMGLSLQRLNKLVSYAKANETQWKAFKSKTGHHEIVLELCSSLTSKEAVINTLGIEALYIIRLLINGDDNDVGDDILKILSTRLVASNTVHGFQDVLLETLHMAYSSTSPQSQPDYLIPVLLEGITSTATDTTLDKWITLLCTIIPLLGSSSLLSNLLKITSCLCKRVDLYFSGLQELYGSDAGNMPNGTSSHQPTAAFPERSISNLLAGMEYVLARAHHQSSLSKEEQDTRVNGSLVDLPSSRSTANDRLTVILCMQDALKICSRLWSWRSAGRLPSTAVDVKSFQHLSSRLRTRSRRILENLVEAEPQECLECLIGIWVEKQRQYSQQNQVLELLQTLDGARPKFMMPATFNAIYNRTNPGALDQSQKSSLSVNITAIELIAFLNDYTDALEDDLLDEIWSDCTNFLKEILANPMPHRQILFKLLEFTAVLCKKMDNTNFGEEARMRKELADLCTRLFAAIFTIKPAGYDGTGSQSADVETIFGKTESGSRFSLSNNALQILQNTVPNLAYILTQSDRLVTVYNGIATNITGPLLHSRSYPSNISPELLALLQAMSIAPAAVKAWKKDVMDAFDDVRFFQNQQSLVTLGWLPLIKQLAIVDKMILPELLSRIAPPTTAGLMFGVGATAARTEADKRTQATLKRIAVLLLSMESDAFMPHLEATLGKLEELLAATAESSPSSGVKSDVFLLMRTMLLTFSQAQLSAYWPLVDEELRSLCLEIISKDSTKFTMSARLQGAKLLDLLLLLKPDEFQIHEWLFVTDTVDAIYPPHDLPSVALADRIALAPSSIHMDISSASATASAKKPWLCTDESRDSQDIESLLANFFSQLSIRTFEDSYSLRQIDLKACKDDLIKDLFTE